MNREIKFRAWDTSDAEHPHMLGPYDFTDSIFNYKGVRELPLMQFTGLLDKNGVMIFESDIFRVEEQADDRMYYLVIHWIKEWCMFGCLTVGEYNDYLATGISALDEPMFWTYTLEDTDSQKFFLCGNIYQNPKLIEL